MGAGEQALGGLVPGVRARRGTLQVPTREGHLDRVPGAICGALWWQEAGAGTGPLLPRPRDGARLGPRGGGGYAHA